VKRKRESKEEFGQTKRERGRRVEEKWAVERGRKKEERMKETIEQKKRAR